MYAAIASSWYFHQLRCRPVSRLAGLAMLAVALLVAARPAVAKPFDPTEQDCFWQLREAAGTQIRCAFTTRMSEEERAEFKRVTRGYVDDATCTIRIDISRALVDSALGAVGDHVFEAPQQLATCTLSSGETAYPISLTFAPRVVFKAGVAVEASPGVDNVTGITRLLWWPVALWVNRTNLIEGPTLRIVNAYKARFGKMPIPPELSAPVEPVESEPLREAH